MQAKMQTMALVVNPVSLLPHGLPDLLTGRIMG
jgi:hypothetical protein